MTGFTIHSTWGDIDLNPDTARDWAYLEAVFAPASVGEPLVRNLVKAFSPNTVSGLHLFTRLGSAGKLSNPVDSGIVFKNIDPITISGVRTAVELKKRGVFNEDQLEEILSRFDVDEFLALDPNEVEEVQKAELVGPLVKYGVLTGAKVDALVSKIDVHEFTNVEILLVLNAEQALQPEHIMQVSEKFEIEDFDLTNTEQLAVLDGLFELGAFTPSHLRSISAADPETIPTDMLLHEVVVGQKELGFGLA